MPLWKIKKGKPPRYLEPCEYYIGKIAFNRRFGVVARDVLRNFLMR